MMNPSYSKTNLFIRSLMLFIYSLFSIVIHSICVFLLWPYRDDVIRHFLKNYLKMLKLICHLDYKLIGAENIPKKRNGIILSKHQSTWETFFLPVLFHDPAIILKREILWVPFFGWGLAASKPIAINRNKKRNAMQQIITQGKQFLAKGRWILIFPEGTRMPTGTVGNYKAGGARLAVETGYPVLPIAHNAGLYWPKRKFIKQPGTIHVVIGPLIETKGRTADEVLNSAKEWIENTMLEINRVC